MVATERIRLADIEELREAKLEKEALRSALRLLEGHAASPGLPPATASAFTLRTITLSTSITDAAPASSSISSATSPSHSQHLPSSISTANSSGTTACPLLSSTLTIRQSLSPPAPLEAPTTPFEHDAEYVGTPSTRPQVEVPPAEPDADRDPGTSAKDVPAAANLEVKMEEQASSGEAQEPNTREEVKPQGRLKAGQDEKEEVEMQSYFLDERKNRSPELGLLSGTHPLGPENDPDPWAGAQSASSLATKGSVGQTS
ncbi:hypothetical protein C0992_006024 [Termitomyces sp. T32_za158]|nr:hypothetical protein C0992_006024 [Termitomyces sp. T32_za158]